MIRQNISFDSCFEVFLADTAESKQIHYQLRCRVYRDEADPEGREHFFERLEKDEWDKDAIHFLARHKYSGRWLATLRLVTQADSACSFPERRVSNAAPANARFAEISRLCIIKGARRFALEHSAARSIESSDQSWNTNFLNEYGNINKTLMWGLYRAAAVYSAQHGIQYWYLSLNPALAYFFSKEGFNLQQVVEPVHDRSQRVVYRLMVDGILENPLWLRGFSNGFQLYSGLAGEFSVEFKQRQLRPIGVISFVSRV